MQTQTQMKDLNEVLRKRNLTPEDVDIVLSKIPLPKVPMIHVTREIYPNISPLATLAVGGPGGAIGALFALSYATPKYIITTKDVLSGKIAVSKKVLDYMVENYNVQVINLDALTDYKQLINTFLTLLRAGGIYVSGLPTIYLILLSQLAGFGKLWHFDNENELFYVF